VQKEPDRKRERINGHRSAPVRTNNSESYPAACQLGDLRASARRARTVQQSALHIRRRSVRDYEPINAAFPGVTSQIITRFMEESATLTRTVWLRRVRAWARQQGGT
jgi:hypothetical protein